MEEYPSNSRERRPRPSDAGTEKPKVEPVVTGKVTRRKKPLGKRFSENFLGGDAKGVWSYVLWDVMIPAARDLVVDAGQEALHRAIYGDSRPAPRGRTSYSGPGSTSRVAYNKPGFMQDPRERERESRASRSRLRTSTDKVDWQDILLATRVEADAVIDRMYDLLDKYNQVTVGDLYDLLNITGEYTDENWGWYDLSGSHARRTTHGYLLDLPRPEQLDRR